MFESREEHYPPKKVVPSAKLETIHETEGFAFGDCLGQMFGAVIMEISAPWGNEGVYPVVKKSQEIYPNLDFSIFGVNDRRKIERLNEIADKANVVLSADTLDFKAFGSLIKQAYDVAGTSIYKNQFLVNFLNHHCPEVING